MYLPKSYNKSNSNPVPLLLDFHGCSLLINNQYQPYSSHVSIHHHNYESTIITNQPLEPINTHHQSTAITTAVGGRPIQLFINYHPCAHEVGEVHKLFTNHLQIITHALINAVGEVHQVGRNQTFVSLRRRKDFYWSVLPTSYSKKNNFVKL